MDDDEDYDSDEEVGDATTMIMIMMTAMSDYQDVNE